MAKTEENKQAELGKHKLHPRQESALSARLAGLRKDGELRPWPGWEATNARLRTCFPNHALWNLDAPLSSKWDYFMVSPLVQGTSS